MPGRADILRSIILARARRGNPIIRLLAGGTRLASDRAGRHRDLLDEKNS